MSQPYHVVYDGDCNLCVTLVQLLERLDRGTRFAYIPMQDLDVLAEYDITPKTCELGMILVDANDPDNPDRRWQGSDAAEEIGRILPGGEPFVAAYRTLPGLKSAGDRAYEQVRDNRYDWFGRRQDTYRSTYRATIADRPNPATPAT
ncbi:MAG: thiol-disulfide oxidoreductase DCC family protein [Geitlerinemataceae cyanobacterium]